MAKGQWKKIAAQLIAAMAGGTITAAVGAPGAVVPVAAAVGLLVKVVDILATRRSRRKHFQDELTKLNAEKAFEGVSKLREVFVRAAGIVPDYKTELERLAEVVREPDRAKEDPDLLEAVTKVFDERRRATDDPAEFARMVASGHPWWPEHYIRPGAQEHVKFFRGRATELAQLHEAVERGDRVIRVIGMAGQGKSALLAKWWQADGRKTLAESDVFWCRPYDTDYTFSRFLDDILPYLTDGRYDPRDYPTTQIRSELLCQLLRQRPTLLVLDGLDMLVTDATGWDSGSMVLFSSRAVPAALDGRPMTPIGTTAAGRTLLGPLELDAAVKLLESLGVNGEPDNLHEAAREYNCHALTLRVLAGELVDLHGGDVTKRPEVDVLADDERGRLFHLLDRIAERRGEYLPILSAVACCLVAAPVEMLATLRKTDEKAIRKALSRLDKWQLVAFDAKAGRADLHPLLEEYFLGRLGDEKKAALRCEMAAWFGDQPVPDEPQSIEQVQPLILACRHALAGRNVDLATDFLFGTPPGKHYETLNAWLRAFGHLDEDVALHSAAIDQYERLVAAGQEGLRNDLASAYNNRGGVLHRQGRLHDAIADYEKAVEIRETLIEQEGHRQLRNDLAGNYNNRGIALEAQGRLDEAIADYDKAVEIRETLVHEEGCKELRNELAGNYNNRGGALEAQGRLDEAVADYDKAVEIRETLVYQEGRKELRNNLAGNYNNRGTTLEVQGRLDEAVADFEKAVEIYETLVEREGRKELRNDLAMVYNNRGTALKDQGRLDEAVADYDKAVEIRQTLVYREGRSELRNDLASAYNNRGIALEAQGRLDEAVADYDKAVEVHETLVEQEAREELVGNLAKVLFNRAMLYSDDGKPQEAERDMLRNARLLAEAIRRGREDLLANFLQTAAVLAELLLSLDKAQDAAAWVNEAVEFLSAAVAKGRVSEILLKRATGFYAHLKDHVEPLSEAGLDVEAFNEVGKALAALAKKDSDEENAGEG